MGTYVSLVSWTDQGIKNFADTVSRADAAAAAAAQVGGRFKDIYWTVGPYDIVVVSEFPDDETATAYLLKLGALGNVRTTTLRAFGKDEMAGIVAKAAG